MPLTSWVDGLLQIPNSGLQSNKQQKTQDSIYDRNFKDENKLRENKKRTDRILELDPRPDDLAAAARNHRHLHRAFSIDAMRDEHASNLIELELEFPRF